MKNEYTFLVVILLFATACSKKLDDVPFNDNPYDKDYTGAKVVRIDSIVRDFSSGPSNRVYYSKTRSFDNHDGIRLYRNGIKINTHYSNGIHPPFFSDISASSGVTYTYEVRLYLGSGEAGSAPVTYVTP